MGVFDTINKEKTKEQPSQSKGGLFSQLNKQNEEPVKKKDTVSTKPKVSVPSLDSIGMGYADQSRRFTEYNNNVQTKAKAQETKRKESQNAYERWYEKNLSGTFLDKLAGGLQSADRSVSNFKSGAMDTATLGATQGLGRASIKNMGKEELSPFLNDRLDSTSYKVGHFGGYVVPGVAADRLVVKTAGKALEKLPKIARGFVRGAAAGSIDTAAQEVGDVAFREGQFDPLNVALGAGLGGGLGAAIPAAMSGMRQGLKSLLRPTLDSTIDMTNAINSVARENLPQSVRRVVSKDAVPELFPERVKRSFGAPKISPEVSAQPLDSINTAPLRNTVDITPDAPMTIRERISVEPSQTRERGAVQNVRNNAGLSDELNARLDQSPNKNYEVATDIAAAQKAIKNTEDMSQAEINFLGNRAPEKEDIATAVLLMKRLGAQGKHEQAANIYDKLITDLTRGGQTTQAASLIGKLSPEGQLINLLRRAKENGKVVPVEDRVKFKDLAAKAQQNAGAGIRENQYNAILNKMEKGENVTVAEIKELSDYLSGAEKVVNPPKPVKVVDELPDDFKDIKKRERIVSYLDDVEQAALARIAARKSRLNALPIDEWGDHAIVVAAQLAKGAVKAASHVDDLVRLFGEEIRPVATKVFQKAQGLVKTVSRGVGEGDITRAQQMLRQASGQAAAEKAIVQETANHIKKLIADAKAGNLNPADVQKLRDYSEEIAEMTSDKISRLPSQEEKFLQSVKSLAKKIAKVESENIPADQANREVSSLLRQVLKISDEGTNPLTRQPIDNKALSDIAHDVMGKTRPNPKPTTLQEKIVEKYLKENPKVSEDDIKSLRDLAKNITRLSSDAKIDADIAMQKILNSYEKSSVWDKTLALRYMGMLLNTHTQAINALSGPIMATTGTVADVFGTMLDISLSAVMKNRPRTTTLYGTNPLRFMAGYMKNLKTGSKAGWQGVNPAGIQSTNEIRGLAFKSPLNPLGLAERTLGAVAKGPDFATYKTVFDSEMKKQGFLSAKNQKIKGKANIDKHIKEFVNDPPEEAILQADRIGKNTTFQRSDTTGGKIANHLNNAPMLVKPGVNAIFPFVRTPINIASTAVTMTPVGIIKGLFQLASKSKASQREAIRTMSMGVTGTGIGVVGFYLFQLGIITGANDSGNKDIDNIREQAGKGKYRFNTSALNRYLGAMVNGEGAEAAEKAAQYREGDKQFDYNKLQPLALALSGGASLAENKGKSVSSQLSNAATDSFGSLFGMSTLKGVQNIFQPSYGGTMGEKALGAPSRVAESFFKSFSWGGLAQEAKRQDPIQRKTPFNDGPVTNTKEYFKSRIPGMSQDLPARKTTLGQDYKNVPGIKGAYLNPYRSEVAPYNKAAEIISGLIDRTGDLKLAPTPPEKSVKGKDANGKALSVEIPAKRYAKLQEDVGNAIIKLVPRIPEKLSDADKGLLLEEIYKQVKKMAMDQVKTEYGIVVD